MDPTVKGGASNPFSVTKSLRGLQIARENRLPAINLTESAGADLRTQKDIFVRGGRTFRELTELSKAGIPTISLVFGSSTAGGAYIPGMSDYTVLIKERSKVFLGGPPLVKMATGEDATEEELGGAEMHARTSGLGDYLAEDELDGIRITRQLVRNLGWTQARARPTEPADAAAVRPRGAARHRLGRPARALRRPRGARPHPRRQPLRGVQGRLRHQPRHRVGVDPRLPGRHPRQQRGAVQPGVGEGRAVHPARQPATARWSSCRTSPGSWSAPATSRAASSRTAPSSSTPSPTPRCPTSRS
jgi:hypothetical protein